MTVPDSAYVINLARRPDRLAAFQERAAALGFPVAVAPGIEPKEIPDHWGGSNASYGCVLAHREVLLASHGVTAIFEDDAVVPADLGPRISEALDAAPPDWEIIMLGAGKIAYGERWCPPIHQVTNFALTHAYLISAAGRPHVLQITAEARRHWDGQLGRVMGARGHAWLLGGLPVMQDDALGSDIPDSARLPRSWS